jgi:hypothetical protein
MISLIGYFILNYTNISIPLTTFKNINEVEYYNGIIYFAIKSFSVWGNDGFDRNIGAFWEPGVFATFILVAIILELWNTEQTSKFTIFLFTITLFTTKSTFAYLMILPIGISFISVNNVGRYREVIFNFILLVSFFLIFFNFILILEKLNTISPGIFGKLITESTSVNERIESPLTNLHIFKDYPILGAGIGNTENLYSSLTSGSQTSSSTYFLASFGILGIFYSLFFIYGILIYNTVNLTSRFMFLVIILSQINKEPHMYFTATFILLFYFLYNVKSKQ